MKRFFAELKRRNVYRVAVAYAVVAWLLVQIATQVFPIFEIPNWAARLVVLLLVIGFPVALILAWAFELTPEGIQLTTGATPPEARRTRMRRPLFWSLVGLGAALALVLSFQLLRPVPPSPVKETSQAPGRRAVAVLPFENLSEDKANAYFADGIQDEIITRLAKIGDLKVISRASTNAYRARPEKLSEIARQLGVGHIVEGSVQKIANRVRINVQLIEAQTDEHLWAELYDRDLTDIFSVQSEVATAIAKTLRAKLTAQEQDAVTDKPTANLGAYDAYLRGIELHSAPDVTPEIYRKTAEAFEEAVRLDPLFAQAWAALSRASASLFFLQFDTSPARKELARTAAETATRLAPNAAETLLANAYYRYHVERDYPGAKELFEKFQRAVPSSSEAPEALAKIARRQSRWKDSLRLYEEASKLNPRGANLLMDRAWTFSMLRDYAATEQAIDRVLAILPGDLGVLLNRAWMYQTTGRLDAARAVMESLPVKDVPPSGIPVLVNQFMLERRFQEGVQLMEQRIAGSPSKDPGDWQWLGWLRQLAGDHAGARQAYLEGRTRLQIQHQQQPRSTFILYALAACEAGLGNKEAALREAERAVSILPATEDPVAGPVAEENLARIEVQVGELERALGRIERLLVTPYGAFPLTQALLRIDPSFDPLRGHPRFKALIEGPEPKTIYH